MKRIIPIIILASLTLPACNPTTPTAPAGPITVQYTAATAPWLAGLYDCAGVNVVTAEQRSADFLDPQPDNLAIRIGQPANLTSPASQIGSEEILVILNPQNPINSLTAEQVRGLFSGQILTWQEVNGSNAPVQVWVYSSGEDVQQIFEQATLGGSPLTSTARLATDPNEMVKAIASDVNAVGILNRHWKLDGVTVVYSIAIVPVLALASAELQGKIRELLACMQR